MGYFYTDQLKERLDAGASLNGKTLTLNLMSRAPYLREEEDVLKSFDVTDIDSITDLDGWEEVSVAGYARQTVVTPVITSGNNRYVQLEASLIPFPDAMEETVVEAVVFSISGPDIGLPAGDAVLFGTTTPFSRVGSVIFRGGDGISALLSDPETGVLDTRWFFGWAVDGATAVSFVEGTTSIQQSAPEFEVSHVHHVWMLPQRINYIANPSFEQGVTHWQTNVGVMDRVEPADSYPSVWVGHRLGPASAGVLPQYNTSQRLYLRSNPFYPRNEQLTFQIQAKGVGIARVGLAYHTRDYSEYVGDWGLRDSSLAFEEWTLSTAYTHLQGIRTISEGYEGYLMIEVRPPENAVVPEITIDQIMVEEGALLNWQYFDGDSTFGALGDFSWYGVGAVVDKRGKSYSMWYNNRRAIAGRLFGRALDDTAMYTSYDEQLDSLVSQWTPAGSVVVPHWDVVDQDDLRSLPLDRSATTLPITIWPELAQPFEIVEVIELTNTSAIFKVVGEGAYPISGGYILWETTSNPLVFGSRPWEEVGISQHTKDERLAELFDRSKPQTISMTWEELPIFTLRTIFLERGDAVSPLSFLPFVMVNFNSTTLIEAGVVGTDASVEIYSNAINGEALGVGYETLTRLGVSAVAAVGTGSGLAIRSTVTLNVEVTNSTGSGFNATAVNLLQVSSGNAAGTGVGYNTTTSSTGTSAEAYPRDDLFPQDELFPQDG